ncbi:MAG: hypothetical protein NVV66_18410 [Cellulomonas sp.]|uniref:hypothetical protein n=1 Tax=Cellulomonas sp. TaxID=40001 RepID=UPI00258327BD|nr:hypothetical protein [Cellulomonas sp.]MCR6706571.1 hypothetical protein [Cellulomonas sp.]
MSDPGTDVPYVWVDSGTLAIVDDCHECAEEWPVTAWLNRRAERIERGEGL